MWYLRMCVCVCTKNWWSSSLDRATLSLFSMHWRLVSLSPGQMGPSRKIALKKIQKKNGFFSRCLQSDVLEHCVFKSQIVIYVALLQLFVFCFIKFNFSWFFFPQVLLCFCRYIFKRGFNISFLNWLTYLKEDINKAKRSIL